MDSSTQKKEAGCKIEPKEIKEEHFKIEDPIHLVTVRPIEIVKEEPVDDFSGFEAEPQPSSSRAIAEVRVATPPLPEVKFDPFCFAPRGRFCLLLLLRIGQDTGPSLAATRAPPRG